jgi:RNA processing factor Prp31
LQRFEPHPEDGAELAEPIDVTRVVKLATVADVLDQQICEVVAVPRKWVIVSTVPEISEVVNNLVDFVRIVVRDTYLDSFTKDEAGRVAFIDDNDARASMVMAAV